MKSSSITVPAPAKLNLFLHVTGRRPDGYHTLESVMVLLDFGDRLTLTRRNDEAINVARPLPGVPIESDLVYRAARLLQEHVGISRGVDLELEKRIPIGAGMGGGSSDAASVLLALNRLWNLDLKRDELMRLGLSLGADVPFFIFGCNAHVSGIGEQLREITIPPFAYLIAVPPVHVSTRTIFAAAELHRDTAPSGAGAFVPAFGHNDLQRAAEARHRAISKAIDALDRANPADVGRTGLTAARMSGSGSAVFRVLDRGFPESETGWRAAGDRHRDEWKFLQRIRYHLPKAHDLQGKPVGASQIICARGIRAHPLRDFAAK